MLDFLYLVLSCVLSIEVFLKLRFVSYVSSISANSYKVFHIIFSSNISDHWKEKMVPIYAFNLLKNALLILGILLIVIFLFFTFILFSNNFIIFIFSTTGLLSSIFISILYLKLRSFLFKWIITQRYSVSYIEAYYPLNSFVKLFLM